MTDLLGIPNKRRRRTKGQIQVLRNAIFMAAYAEHPVTCRRLFYRLVGEGLIEKTEAQYQGTIIRLVGEMREDGGLPWEWITDHTRLVRRPDTFNSLGEALESTARFYRRALWEEQDVYVEVWCEKAGLTGVLYPETSAWDVPLMICGGSPSKTFLHAAAEQIVANDKPAYLYYLGDHDPSGVAIRKRVERDLERYAPDTEIYFEHLAVTPEQIAKWSLPTRPTKRSDPNAKNFSGESVEVDAIPADKLRVMVNDAIVQHIDTEIYNRLRTEESVQRESLRLISGNWEKALEAVQ